MKKVINAFLFFLLILFACALVSVGVDYIREGSLDIFRAIALAIFSFLTIKGIRGTYRKAFKSETVPNNAYQQQMLQQQILQQQMMQQQMMRQNMAAPLMPQNQAQEPNPEMDHVDDMAVQYNPYFTDVYEEQIASQRERQQVMQRQLAEQQMLQQQMAQQQMLQQQMAQQQLVQQKMMQQQILQQQRVDQELLEAQLQQVMNNNKPLQ
ncbi:MAG: hypothetical protein J6Y10_03090 [Lachnospiraceae bacterium]|nr:hypothetical protein [Lachnospiraceae bacterium]